MREWDIADRPDHTFFSGEWGILGEFGLGKQLQAVSRYLTGHPNLQDPLLLRAMQTMEVQLKEFQKKIILATDL